MRTDDHFRPLPAWARQLLASPEPLFIHELYKRAFRRVPNEYETSYFLHRLLIAHDSKEAIAQQILQSAGFQDAAAEKEIRTLLHMDSREFVDGAYRRLCGRSPSGSEFDTGVAVVDGGLLGRIALLRQLGQNLPEWDAYFPAVNDVPTLLALDGELFVRSLYGLVHGREATAQELNSALARLSEGRVAKTELLTELADSTAGSPIDGVEALKKHHRWFALPVIGRLLRVLSLISNLPNVERELEAIRFRHADLDVRCAVLSATLQGLRSQVDEVRSVQADVDRRLDDHVWGSPSD